MLSASFSHSHATSGAPGEFAQIANVVPTRGFFRSVAFRQPATLTARTVSA